MAFKLDKQTSQKQEFKKYCYLLRQFKVSSSVFIKLTFRLSFVQFVSKFILGISSLQRRGMIYARMLKINQIKSISKIANNI